MAPPALYERAAALGREHGFVVASDEAYSELWLDGEAPGSALAVPDRRGVVVLNTLSKRSSMPGYRSGFVAGDADVIAALKRFRPNTGALSQTFVQRAAIAAWEDEAHVAEVRARYRAKRDVLLPALRAAGLEPAGGPGSFFLWLRLAGGDGGRPADDEAAALALLDDHGLVAGPRVVPRSGRRGPPAPRARAHAGALRRGGPAARLRARGLAVGVQGGVEAAPAPAARPASTAPSTLLRRNSRSEDPEQLAGLDDGAVGQPRPACRP